MGSSPRMRGTQFATFEPLADEGIIPAYAGNTNDIIAHDPNTWDHPRVCGEHFDHKGETLPAQGSSPRMRGTPGRPTVPRDPEGIIPAYAGNTEKGLSSDFVLGDHPRVCGEHEECQTVFKQGQGSSPRMRGTPNQSVQSADHAGIIPAYAGNTLRD